MEQQQTKGTINKVKEFVKLSELEQKNLSQFEKYPCRFLKTQRNGRELVSINLEIHPTHYKRLALKNGKDYLPNEMFDLIAVEVGLPYTDQNGRPITEWPRKVMCRFVTGKSAADNDYHYLEVLFKKGIYLVHLFESHQIKLIKSLEEKGMLKIKWIERPDLIDEDVAELDF